MATQAEKVQAMMERMRADYVAALPRKFAAIDALAEHCLAGSDSLEEPRNELRRLVHSLKGSGATFGLPALSESAAALEEVILAWRDAAGGAAPADAIRGGIAALRAAAGTPPAATTD